MNMTHTTTFEIDIPGNTHAGENKSRSERHPTCRLTFELPLPGDRGTIGDETVRTGRTAVDTSGAACRQSETVHAVCTSAGAPVLFLWGEHAEWFLS